MIRIGISGIGGVGGYFGGLLAEKYAGSESIEINFFARPATAKVIQENGLKLISPEGERNIRPTNVYGDPTEAGQLDVLICATKSYDLEEGLLAFRRNITQNTLILPLLNGVDAKERIQKLYPDAEVLDGCVYIVAHVVEPGVIQKNGAIEKLQFGSKSASPSRLEELYTLFKEAGIDVTYSKNIAADTWEKFVFISPLASLTSFFDLPVGAILENAGHKAKLIKLITELTQVAKAKGIELPEDIIELTLRKMEKLAPETTSSMHRDYKKGGRTEYRSLTQYVVENAKKFNLPTPAFDEILTEFQMRDTIAKEQ